MRGARNLLPSWMAKAVQAKKITDAVRDRLPGWIHTSVKPILESTIERNGVQARLSISGKAHDAGWRIFGTTSRWP